jgi:hypothetical protein
MSRLQPHGKSGVITAREHESRDFTTSRRSQVLIPHVPSPMYDMDVYIATLCQQRDETRWDEVRDKKLDPTLNMSPENCSLHRVFRDTVSTDINPTFEWSLEARKPRRLASMLGRRSGWHERDLGVGAGLGSRDPCEGRKGREGAGLPPSLKDVAVSWSGRF